MTIRIERTSGDEHTLFVQDVPIARVQTSHAGVMLNWSIYGPQPWPEAKLVLEGLLELSLFADQLTLRPRHGKAKQERTTRDEVLGVRFQAREEGDDDIEEASSKAGAPNRYGRRSAPAQQRAQSKRVGRR
jgi:hypothetical protein